MECKKQQVIIHLVGRTSGGVASVAITLMKKQIESGKIVYAIIFLGEDDISKTIDSKINVIFVKPKTGYGQNMLWGMGIRNIYNTVKTDNPGKTIIVHAHNVATVGLLSNIVNIPIVCTIHGTCVRGKLTLRDRISEFVNIQILRKLNRNDKPIVAVSKATAEHYQRSVERNSIQVIYNGVDIHEANPILAKKGGEFWIGHVGGVTKSKGWDTVAEAFGIVKTQNKKVKLLCAGNIGFEENELKLIMDRNSGDDGIKLLGLIPDAGNTLIPLLDVLVLPSIGEGMPMSILESFSYGVPVIATDVGGISEVVINNINGFLVQKDSEEIAERILQLMNNKDIYIKISRNAKITYEKYFSANLMNKAYENIYCNIICM